MHDVMQMKLYRTIRDKRHTRTPAQSQRSPRQLELNNNEELAGGEAQSIKKPVFNRERDDMKIKRQCSFQTTDVAPINAISLVTSKYIFLAQGNGVSLYPTETQKRLTTYTGHNRSVSSMAFMSSTYFVSCSDVLVTHDVSKETYVRRINMDSRFRINDVVKITEDVIACCGEDKKVSIFDLRQASMWKPIQTFEEAKDALNGLSYWDQGKIIYCGGSDGRLLSYDLRKGVCIADDFGGMITSVDCMSNSVLMSVLNSGESVKVWDVSQQQMARRYEKKKRDKEYKIESKFGGYGGFIVSGSEFGEVYIWDTKTSSEIVVPLDDDPGQEYGKSVTNSIATLDQTVCCGRGDGQVTLFSVEN